MYLWMGGAEGQQAGGKSKEDAEPGAWTSLWRTVAPKKSRGEKGGNSLAVVGTKVWGLM